MRLICELPMIDGLPSKTALILVLKVAGWHATLYTWAYNGTRFPAKNAVTRSYVGQSVIRKETFEKYQCILIVVLKRKHIPIGMCKE